MLGNLNKRKGVKLMSGNWRYKSTSDWQFDKMQGSESEDVLIDDIEGIEAPGPDFDAYEVLKSLSDIEAKIVEAHLFNGITFREIGEDMNYSRQNIFRIYKVALGKLKAVIPYVG